MEPLKLSLLLLVLQTSLLLDNCSAQSGLQCSRDSDCKQSSGFVCSPTSRMCECGRGYRLADSSSSSWRFTSCTRSIIQHGAHCHSDRDTCAGGPNSECASMFLGEQPTCGCKPGFVYHKATGLCQTQDFVDNYRPSSSSQPSSPPSGGSNKPPKPPTGALPSEPCQTNGDCHGYPNATCYYFVSSNIRQCNCTFDTHYYSEDQMECLPKKPMGSGCHHVDECPNIANVECAGPAQKSKFCKCKSEFYFDQDQGKCVQSVDIGHECEDDGQCKSSPNSHCKATNVLRRTSMFKVQEMVKTCSCKSNMEFYAGAGTCVDAQGPIQFGRPCKFDSQCEGGNYAECSALFLGQAPACRCAPEHVFDGDRKMCVKEEAPPEGDSEFNSEGGNSGGGGGEGKRFDVKLNLAVVCSNGNCKAVDVKLAN